MKAKPDKKMKLTAYHEAGHAVASFLLHVDTINAISVIPDEVSEGRTHHSAPGRNYHPDYDDSPRTRSKTEKRIMSYLAGDVAESLLLKWKKLNTNLTDYQKAVDLASYQCDGEPDETGAYVTFLYYKTRNLLRRAENWTAISDLASILIERRRIGRREFYPLIRKSLRRSTTARKIVDAPKKYISAVSGSESPD